MSIAADLTREGYPQGTAAKQADGENVYLDGIHVACSGTPDGAAVAAAARVIGVPQLTEKRLIEGEDHSATLKKLGMQIADLRPSITGATGFPTSTSA